MLKYLCDGDLWATLTRLSKACKVRQHVAVPYLGQGGSDLLKFRPGDVLICALNKGQSRNGSVYPAEIRKLQKKGVEVYLEDDLHAKVFLFGSKAVVCSANLSVHSRSGLDEAGLLTTDRGVVSKIRQWFSLRKQEMASQQYVRDCNKVYQPPEKPRAPKKRGQENRSRMWLFWSDETDEYPPLGEGQVFRAGESVAKKRLRQPRHFEADSVRCSGRNRFTDEVCPEDAVIEVWKDREVYEPCRVLTVRYLRSKQATYIYFESPRQSRTMPWKRFKQLCRQQRLRVGRNIVWREMRETHKMRSILSHLR
jgi:hypothetical protein